MGLPGPGLRAKKPGPGQLNNTARAAPSAGPQLALSSPSAGRHLAVSWPSVGRQLAVSWPSVGPQLALSWPSVGPQLALSWVSVLLLSTQGAQPELVAELKRQVCRLNSATFRDARPRPKVAAWPGGSWGVSTPAAVVCNRAPSSGSRSDSGVSRCEPAEPGLRPLRHTLSPASQWESRCALPAEPFEGSRRSLRHRGRREAAAACAAPPPDALAEVFEGFWPSLTV